MIKFVINIIKFAFKNRYIFTKNVSCIALLEFDINGNLKSTTTNWYNIDGRIIGKEKKLMHAYFGDDVDVKIGINND